MAAQLFTTRPPDFTSATEVVACFCEWEDKILLLKRHPEDVHGETWSAPGGGIEPGETPAAAAVRELLEETGILIEAGHLESLGTLYIRLPRIEYTFYMFRTVFADKPDMAISLDENTEALWATTNEALRLSLIPAGREVLEHYAGLKKD